MTAKEARDLSNSVRAQLDAEKKVKLNNLVKETLHQIEIQAKTGATQLVFCSNGKSFTPSELDAVRYQLKELGYNFSNQTENGLSYEILYW